MMGLHIRFIILCIDAEINLISLQLLDLLLDGLQLQSRLNQLHRFTRR